MKLSEALIRRADIQKRIQQLRQRLNQNALVQEGGQPAEHPEELLAESRRALGELVTLIKQINRTNLATRFDGNRTLTDALAERDMIMLERSILTGLVESAAIRLPRYGREVRFERTVDVPQIQQRIDTLSQRYRELDTRIQELNWQTELIE
ncbi:MAG: DIP1984 family protein [Chloroflexota bacterium]